jgi:hypothetical protein
MRPISQNIAEAPNSVNGSCVRQNCPQGLIIGMNAADNGNSRRRSSRGFGGNVLEVRHFRQARVAYAGTTLGDISQIVSFALVYFCL